MKSTMENSFTEKFGIELNCFCKWFYKFGYLLKENKDTTVHLTPNIIEYQEPCRNKLERFVEKVMSSYIIIDSENTVILDYKLLSKQFKSAPKEKQTKESKELKQKSVNEGNQLKIDWKLDTNSPNQIFYSKLDLTTKELIKLLNTPPKKTGKDQDPWRYEWKIEFEKNVYSIYDWSDTLQFQTPKHIEWNLSSEYSGNPRSLIEYISLMKK